MDGLKAVPFKEFGFSEAVPFVERLLCGTTIKREQHTMSELARTGVSLEEDLLNEFDRLIAKRGYKNRSEAFRDLIREALLSETVYLNKPVVGTLTLVYDHHVPNLSEKLTAAQHSAGAMVLAATHVHL